MATKQDVSNAFAIYFPSGDPIDVKYFFSPWFIWICTVKLDEEVKFEFDIPMKIFKAIYRRERFRKRFLEKCMSEGLIRKRPKGYRTPRGTLIKTTNYGWSLECLRGNHRMTIEIAEDSFSVLALNIQWPHIFTREVLNGTTQVPRFFWTNSSYELLDSYVPANHTGTILFVNRALPNSEAGQDPRRLSLIINFIENFNSQADSWLIDQSPPQE